MASRRARPLWYYVAALNLALLVPALAVTIVLLHHWVAAERSRLENTTVAINSEALETVDCFLASQIAMLQALATSPALEAGDLERFGRQAAELSALQGLTIILRDTAGQEHVNTQVPRGSPLPSLPRVTDRAVAATGKPTVSDLLIGAVSRQPEVRAGVPVRLRGEIAYVLSASFPAARIGALLSEAGIAPPYSASVTDRTGTIIGRSVATDQATGRPLPGFAETVGDSGSWTGSNLLGVPVFGTYRRSALSGWIVTVGIEQQALQAPLYASLWISIPILIGLGLTALAASGLMARRILLAKNRLAEGARALADGRVIDAPVTPVREVNEIGATLAAASVRLHQQAEALQAANRELETRVAARTRELAEKEALLTMTLDAMDQGLVMVDARGVVAVTNRRFAEILDLDPAFLASRPTDEAMSRALDEAGAFASAGPAVRAGLQADDLAPPDARCERVRPNGQVLEVTSTATADGGILRIYTDVTARRKAEAALAEAHRIAQVARREAEAGSAAKSEFLATMSHEIRTPLTGVLGYADLLTAQSDLAPEHRRLVGRIRSAGEALLTIVDDVLDFSKIEAGEITLDPKPFSPAQLVDEALALVRAAADRKQLALSARIDPAIPERLVGDVGRLRQVLLNLLNNAVKFTRAGSVTVTVACEPAGPDAQDCPIRICVTDTGIGIPEEKRGRLFQRFSQVDGSIQRHYEGTGLGLAISRRLIEAMNGRIDVDSRAGEGSTFWFALKLAKVPLEPSKEAEETASPAWPGMLARILLADDNAINREIVRRLLESVGHAVEVVEDGAAAIQAVRNAAYDLVLMDVQMPGTDGLTATRRIRMLPGAPARVPIIALTANVLPSQVAEFRAAGMDDHIGKPFKREDLFAAVARWCGAGYAPRGRLRAATRG
ncbi:ATP-binding protein [Methylobacterium nodulans]|uniref:histidine kinase n=1 Tax=Methylobacterium nodulans (strain LMG 21967 / CNCM I-2342 / ORS 2060) TaxID=460265 RepID=B8ID49_METNO|nr:ATP-binding protein [Methylobacterium nodulans]ACL59441.1 histidine kinase [Methylobacterium nodulans ORS 2060]